MTMNYVEELGAARRRKGCKYGSTKAGKCRKRPRKGRR